jgi:hypothetical protein
MSSLVASIAEVKDLAVKAQLSVDQFANAAVVLNERQQQIDASRRASPDDREAIDAYLKTIDGAINPDLSASEILMHAGVPKKQGTSQYATRAKQRLLADMRR